MIYSVNVQNDSIDSSTRKCFDFLLKSFEKDYEVDSIENSPKKFRKKIEQKFFTDYNHVLCIPSSEWDDFERMRFFRKMQFIKYENINKETYLILTNRRALFSIN